jgi:hypothetical protein
MMAEPQYVTETIIFAPSSTVISYLTVYKQLATVDAGNITITGEPARVGGTAEFRIRGAPAPFSGTFTKAGQAPNGAFELEWNGSIGFVATFEHGFVVVMDGPSKTTLTHYEKFVGGVVGCLPVGLAKAIVADGYASFETALKEACEEAEAIRSAL